MFGTARVAPTRGSLQPVARFPMFIKLWQELKRATKSNILSAVKVQGVNRQPILEGKETLQIEARKAETEV